MNNFSTIFERSGDSVTLLTNEITQYINKVNKSLPLNVKSAIYLSQKYDILTREGIVEIKDANKGALKGLARKYNITNEQMEEFWKLLKDLKDQIYLMPQMQSEEEREELMMGKLAMDDLTIDLTSSKGRNVAAKIYTPLVIKIVNQLDHKSKLTRPELMSTGMEALTRAMNEWNRDKGVSFKTYASYRIRQLILNDINAEGCLSGTSWYSYKKGYKADAVSIDGFKDGDNEYKSDHIAALGTYDDSDPVEKENAWESIYKLIDDHFSARDAEIFYRIYGLRGYKKEKNKDIAKELGWSEGNVRNMIINKILNFLRKDKRSVEILSNIQQSYNESLLLSLWGMDRNSILEAIINDDMFILLEELNKWKNKNIFIGTLDNALSQLTGMDAEYITSVLSNRDFEFLDGSFKRHKKVIIEFLSYMYPTESMSRKTDVTLLDYMVELQDAYKKHIG